MDVSESENVSEETGISSVPTERTMEAEKFNNEHGQLVNIEHNHETKMHLYVTIFVLGLLLLIVAYGLLMQNLLADRYDLLSCNSLWGIQDF